MRKPVGGFWESYEKYWKDFIAYVCSNGNLVVAVCTAAKTVPVGNSWDSGRCYRCVCNHLFYRRDFCREDPAFEKICLGNFGKSDVYYGNADFYIDHKRWISWRFLRFCYQFAAGYGKRNGGRNVGVMFRKNCGFDTLS